MKERRGWMGSPEELPAELFWERHSGGKMYQALTMKTEKGSLGPGTSTVGRVSV